MWLVMIRAGGKRDVIVGGGGKWKQRMGKRNEKSFFLSFFSVATCMMAPFPPLRLYD